LSRGHMETITRTPQTKNAKMQMGIYLSLL